MFLNYKLEYFQIRDCTYREHGRNVDTGVPFARDMFG